MPAPEQITPVAYLVDSRGRRTHAVVPIEQLSRLQAASAPPDSNPIRLARRGAELTQTRLAAALGISQAMLSRQEQVGRRLHPDTVKAALEAIRTIRDGGHTMTLQQVVEAYGAVAKDSRRHKRRHPTERKLLVRAGDASVRLESEDRTKSAGARATRTGTRKSR